MLTMRDIADHVGVSVSTVSLVLNQRDSGRVKSEVAAHIRRTADTLGYVPNQLARSLKTSQTHTIGMVADQVATVPFAGHMVGGAQQAAWKDGYLLLMIDTDGNAESQTPAVQSLLQRNIDALVIAPAFHRSVDVPFVPASIPVVVLDGRPSDPASTADWVVPDEEQGARDAVEHLIAAGHRRIGFCSVAAYPIAAELRRRGYEKALHDAGLALDAALVVVAEDAATRDGVQAAEELLSRTDRPTAVFCFGDQIAMGFYQVAARLGLRVPEDLSVVGFDNQQFVAEALSPGLTTVQLPHAAMGAWAAERALERVRGEVRGGAEGRLMPCPLVQRSSVAPPGDVT
jgi:LacI family transcriptional regulator